MEIRIEISKYDDLKEMCWGENPKHVFHLVEKYNLEDEFFDYIDELFSDGDFSDTTVNDFIAYELQEGDWIAEQLRLDDVDDSDNLEDITKDLYFSEAHSTITEAKQQNKEDALWDYVEENFDGYSVYDIMQELDGFNIDDLEED